MPTDVFITQTKALRDLGGQRVWSLMISLFGDLAQDKGQSIAGPELSAIMSGLRVKPEAVRVALHRLRNDGWIVSQKSGRISQHSLSAKGLAESVSASPRIYADPGDLSPDWQLVLMQGNEPDQIENMIACGFAPIGPRVFVGPAETATPCGALCLPGTAVPVWLRAQAQPEALRKGYCELLDALASLQGNLPALQDLSAIDVAVLRCLIVHNWRRLVLKHPMLPAPLVDRDWPGHLCHLQVSDLLARYPRPKLKEIEQHRAAA